MIADIGCPGSPMTRPLCFQTAGKRPIIVGFPGLTASPCVMTPGSPIEPMTFSVISLFPAELPPEMITRSLFSKASETAALYESY